MGVDIEFVSVEHYISFIILWGCLPNNEGKNRDPRGGLKRDPGCEGFPTAVSRSNAMRGSCGLGVALNVWRQRIRAPMKGALRSVKPRAERLV